MIDFNKLAYVLPSELFWYVRNVIFDVFNRNKKKPNKNILLIKSLYEVHYKMHKIRQCKLQRILVIQNLVPNWLFQQTDHVHVMHKL